MDFKKIYIYLLPLILLNSCIKDKTNLDLVPENKVTVKLPPGPHNIAIGDTLRLEPVRTFASSVSLSNYDHEWYVDGKLFSKEPTLVFPGRENTFYYVYYYMKDKKNGITYSSTSYINVTVSSQFTYGWGILYEDKNGNSEIAQVNPGGATGVYKDYTDLYYLANKEVMGTQPTKMSAYVVGGNGLFIMQKGGQGPLDLNGLDMKKKLVAKESFTRGAPSDFDPVDMAGFYSADLMVNRNGAMYGRLYTGQVFTRPWISSPLTISKGMRITDIWDSFYINTATALMYDDLNKRVLQYNITSGGITIGELPSPENGYPGEFTSPQDLGSWKYVWGGTFQEEYGTLGAAMLIRSPSDGQLYFETFQFINGMGWSPNVLNPGKRVLFTGSSVVTPESVYKPLKTRNYMFFSGGLGNKDLYYYDLFSGTVKLYASFTSKINALAVSDDYREIGVGLASGSFEIYDISDETLLSGKSHKRHELSGLGKVVDVIFKGENF